MATHCFLLLPILLSIATAASADHAPEPGPAPGPDLQVHGGAPPSLPPGPSPNTVDISAPSPNTMPENTVPSSAPAPTLPEASPSPSPAPSDFSSPAESPSDLPGEDSEPSNSTADPKVVKWCAVREEYADCQYFLSILTPGNYTWSCVRKQSISECLQAIKNKEADLITLDAGLAYVAFSNYSMKAILAEEYCYHSKSYDAVAVVNKAMCDRNSKLSMKNFRGLKSCHPGYLTAAGWNYPVHFLVDTGLQKPLVTGDMLRSDEAVVSDFFSSTCAPSEFEGTGLCTSCGNNGSCPSADSIYGGYSGAFRCLMDGVGDIAFLRSDTALRLSVDGLNQQNWSTKSVNEFMYLCPQGGCRPINDNLGTCTFGSVPANVIMTHNSQSNARRRAIVQTILNANWTDALYSGKNWNDHILSASAQNLVEVTELTRLYLGDSAVLAQSVLALQTTNVSSLPSNGGFFRTALSFPLLFISLIVTLQMHYY